MGEPMTMLAFLPLAGIIVFAVLLVLLLSRLHERREKSKAEGLILTGRIPLGYSEHVRRMLDAIDATRQTASRIRWSGYSAGERARVHYGRSSVRLMDKNPYDKTADPGAWALWNRGYCQGALIPDPKPYMDPKNAY